MSLTSPAPTTARHPLHPEPHAIIAVWQIPAKLSWSSEDTLDGILDGCFYHDFEQMPCNITQRANATMLMLARHNDLDGALRIMRETDLGRVQKIGPMSFSVAPRRPWVHHGWINQDRAQESGNKIVENRNKMVKNSIIYGGSVSEYYLLFQSAR
ncbi:glycosyltransferase family 15 protein [Laetiporus sulphureus 93-53]|uniref:Glycosyltransferase family 15 protein n=1 Tax=Laetiporus sulphureus 93-53 TaxID=1314785 RepID=A0A165BHT5_9APHY|nr:glycosyltransferase family 15 protein [Laetiporus sulphureus 93-53]KZT01083.1 glycosyltransferase family 15 protein [Laetiporus sulphureus 93-53]